MSWWRNDAFSTVLPYQVCFSQTSGPTSGKIPDGINYGLAVGAHRLPRGEPGGADAPQDLVAPPGATGSLVHVRVDHVVRAARADTGAANSLEILTCVWGIRVAPTGQVQCGGGRECSTHRTTPL